MQGQEKRILFTGGGSAGHVTPNIALIKKLRNEGWDIFYIGSTKGVEKEIISKLNIPYFSIPVGKLRRYFSWHNFIDPIKIVFGLIQAFFLYWKIRPRVVFSKGGFVAFPVVVSSWLHRIPIVIHESDLTPGLANRLSFRFANTICVSFEETKKYIKNQDKIIITGTPVREELLCGNINKGLDLCGFSSDKKIILVYAGGLGSKSINGIIRAMLPKILINFQVVHICGKNNLDNGLALPGYKQFEYLDSEFANVLACANIVICRAGANSIYELLALKKPHILIPLPKLVSRGDQIVNAEYFLKRGFSQVVFEEDLSPIKLYEKVIWISQHETETINHLSGFTTQKSNELICDILLQCI
ncbi:MAG: UDP-diphospho-muramoylpentapeptide beta-N-acetylglucosaminyltransferase [Coxiella sp. DG_40]|nr:MAG: UDP-diphospho-muramoylpentapeptide beta-N-acetylglucosaminyltransferase [Coxiella sp. DG_40]